MRDARSLRGNDIHLWLAHDRLIERHQLAEHYHAILSADERARADRLYRAQDRHRFVVSRCMLRTALSSYFKEVRPAEWTFEVSDAGRPMVTSRRVADVWFSISHGTGMVAIAFAAHPRIGLDVEKLGRRSGDIPRPVALLSEDERGFINAGRTPGARSRRLMRVWTLKEAYTKATGAGLRGMNRISFLHATQSPRFTARSTDGTDLSRWHFRHLIIGRHLVAVALERGDGDPLSVATIEWTPDPGGRAVAAGPSLQFVA